MSAGQRTIIIVEDERLEGGAFIYLTKPVGYLDLNKAIEKVLGA
jgi:hypothetical protein